MERLGASTKVTTQMAGKWVKAAFLAVLGIVILYYADGLVTDLETNVSSEFNVSFEWTWDLLTILLWILVAWLFVDAALIVALSLKGDAYSLTDVMNKLRAIEKRMGPPKPKQGPEAASAPPAQDAPKTPEEYVPPPPG
ncbi:MAG: hypothetical protein MUE55_04945 [Thermoplasmata archaeon]|jgi:hypothetical protein|nr:hypothetical protein [Thermoplasmata archaeon]